MEKYRAPGDRSTVPDCTQPWGWFTKPRDVFYFEQRAIRLGAMLVSGLVCLMETTRSTSADHDARKGAMEEERPHADADGSPGLDEDGLPNDATAIAQDAVGARVDGTQG